MQDLSLAGRYAKTLFLESKNKEINLKQFKDLLELFNKNNDIQKLLSALFLKKEKRFLILDVLSKSLQLNASMYNLLKLLIIHNRFQILRNIASSYHKIYNKFFKIQEVICQCVELPDEKQKQHLISLLKEKLSSEVDIHYQINSEIIGGFILKIDNLYLDFSFNKKLKLFQKIFLH